MTNDTRGLMAGLSFGIMCVVAVCVITKIYLGQWAGTLLLIGMILGGFGAVYGLIKFWMWIWGV